MTTLHQAVKAFSNKDSNFMSGIDNHVIIINGLKRNGVDLKSVNMQQETPLMLLNRLLRKGNQQHVSNEISQCLSPSIIDGLPSICQIQ